jgi:hypothetical protein
VELLSPINSSSTDQSDILKANVSQPVRYKNKEIILNGGEIEGHVFRRRIDGGFGIEIDRINAVNGWQQFYGRLVLIGGNAINLQQGTHSATYIPDGSITSLMPTPGVAIIKLTSGGEIPTETGMVWTTELLKPRVTFLPDLRNCQMCFGPPPFH